MIRSRRSAALRSAKPPTGRRAPSSRGRISVAGRISAVTGASQRLAGFAGCSSPSYLSSPLAMPTAQARMTRARGLHAIRSSIRSDNGTSSLPERRIACRFFLFRWHRAHTCHPPKSQDSDLHRPMAWFSSAYVTNGCARPIMGTCARLGSRQARLQHASLADECALCAFFLCKSCFIRDMDLHRPIAALCAVCLATRRVFGTADSGRHTPG